MATTQNDEEQIRLIECPICDHKAKQQVNSPPRTICPKCGNFYVDSGEGPPPPRRLARERQERKNIPENEERNKQGGRLQTISNFFQNLGSNKKGKNKTEKPYNSARSQPSSSMSEDSSSELPPITNGQMINQKRSPNFQLSLTSKSRESLSPRSLRSDKATLSPQNRHIYPVRTKNIDQFLDDIKNAKEKDNWKIVQDFYSTTFDSFMEINAVFKRDPGKEYKSTEDPGLKWDFVQIVFDNLLDTKPVDIRSIISERIKAARQLAENPKDLAAMSAMQKAQHNASLWASSKNLPGKFIGSTGAQILSQEELMGPDKKRQAWAKKDQFHRAAPVKGGIGMALLQKMGWQQGTGLGKNNEGGLEPLALDFKMDRKGKNPVSALVELCKKRRLGSPDFQMVHEGGNDHKMNFLFKVIVNGTEYQPSVASQNKKFAKAAAATAVLQEMGLVPRDS
ncbi:SON [Mytilus edulis]|uniref:SON n=1 Tax=Mytilus edulis TaxID=6550 RepID=A0A8S3UD11_MYTED|nr:SON [Mytilus edulis]